MPEMDAVLVCAICGGPYRDLGRHVRVKHDVDAVSYRSLAGLSMDAPLRSPAFLAAESARVAAMSSANRSRGDAARQKLEAAARRLGYRDLRDLLSRTAAQPAEQVADLLGSGGTGTVRHWRAKLGISGKVVAERVASRRRGQQSGLDDLADGEQPIRLDGKLRCRVCGLWRDRLDQHALRSHRLSILQYRARFGLPATVTLANPRPWQDRDSDPWRRRHEQSATQAGFATIGDLLAACADDRAAKLLGVTTRTVAALRDRFPVPAQPDRSGWWS